MIGSAQHKLVQNLSQQLQPVSDRYYAYCVKDYFPFANLAKEGTFNEKTYMSSFDIKSRFNAVPFEETINIFAQALWRLTKKNKKWLRTESDEKELYKISTVSHKLRGA